MAVGDMDLEGLKKLLAEATPGPWEFTLDGEWPMILSSAHDEDGHRIPVIDLFHGGYEYPGFPLATNGQLVSAAVSALPALIERVERLEEGLRQIGEGDEPRPVGARWRDDGRPSKNDQCTHGIWMYETCGNCIAEFARSILSSTSSPDNGGARG